MIGGAQRPRERGAVGQHVGRRARVDAADAHHRGMSGIDAARDDGLERSNERPRADDRVRGLVRPGAVPAAADELDLEGVRRRRERPLLRHDLAHGEAPVHMRAEDRGHAVERSRLEHRLRPPAGLLGRLQHDQHVARGGAGRQEMRRAHDPGRVDVVAAGVHHARVLGSKGKARFL